MNQDVLTHNLIHLIRRALVKPELSSRQRTRLYARVCMQIETPQADASPYLWPMESLVAQPVTRTPMLFQPQDTTSDASSDSPHVAEPPQTQLVLFHVPDEPSVPMTELGFPVVSERAERSEIFLF